MYGSIKVLKTTIHFSEFLISVFEIIMVKDCFLNCILCQGENIFILFHKQFVASKYLEIVKTESHRIIAIRRLRSSNHRLAIESGRWHKPHPTEKEVHSRILL